MNAYLLDCIPQIIDQRANDYDVKITLYICIAIVLIISAIILLLWHWINVKDGRRKEEMNKNNDNDSDEKLKKAEEKRNYKAKLIAFMDELSKNDSKYKGLDDPACVEYVKLLTRLSDLEQDDSYKK